MVSVPCVTTPETSWRARSDVEAADIAELVDLDLDSRERLVQEPDQFRAGSRRGDVALCLVHA
jgi:hypothetical protein